MIRPFIRKLDLANVLDAEDRARLARVAERVRDLPAREDILREGDMPSDLHLVLDGFACRYKLMAGGRRSIMAFLVPGDLCDLHVAILNEMDHAIATLTPCRVAEIPRAAVEELIANHPRIAHALHWATLVDEAVLREWLANMGQRPADVQMAHLFCELRRRLAVVGLVEGDSFRLPLTQDELADVLGISAVHVNRMLQQLRDVGLIELNGRLLCIPDPERLERFAEFNPNYLHLTQRQVHLA